jgi:hypothetical protein
MDVVRYTCATCGDEHEGLPDLAFESPYHYGTLPEAERRTRAELTSDTCVIDNEDFFVRVCLPIPIRGTAAEFVWGVWVSLSETNFRRYMDLYGSEPPEGEGPYFGWLCNRLPGYPETLSLKTNVYLQKKGERPRIALEPTDHPLALHHRDGIALVELLRILGDKVHEAITCPGGAG